MSAVLVFVGTGGLFRLSIQGFAVVNGVFVVAWFFLAKAIIRERARLIAAPGNAETTPTPLSSGERELSAPSSNYATIRDYAYTNEHEFFAVLTEYFFKSPNLLEKRDPQLYGMLREMFHQDTASLMKQTFSRRSRYGRNALCPCGSGKKYKHCCLLKAAEMRPAHAIDRQPTPSE